MAWSLSWTTAGIAWGILTDLGHVFADLADIVASLDAVLLESNYDPQMLAEGPYPRWLQQRIVGPGGHLSNVEAAEVLHGSATKRVRWVCLAHLSQDNNTAAVALATHRRILGDRLPIEVASRYGGYGSDGSLDETLTFATGRQETRKLRERPAWA